MKLENIERTTCVYENTSERFLFKGKRKYDLQYFQLYAIRMSAMKPRVVAAVKEKWGDGVVVKELSDMKLNEECAVVGVLFRKMEMQPSILKEICQEEGVLPLPTPEKYSDDDDVLILEGGQQRIILCGDIPAIAAVTGNILAVRGREIDGGRFHVDDVCGCNVQPQPLLRMHDEDQYLVVISGLGIGESQAKQLELQLFIDMITGKLGREEDQELFGKVCRLVIAGNCLSESTQDKHSEKMAKYLQKHIQAKSVQPIKTLDDVLLQLGTSLPVDVMPGEYDPTNQFLPQQPLHKCMLPLAHSCAVQSVTNPYKATVAGIDLLATSGQNINNIYQYSRIDDRLDILESTLQYAHLCPTCPDTLSCYPYYTADPFILSQAPHLYVVGNQPSFQTKTVKGSNGSSTVLVTVPSFDVTSTAIFINLKDLSCFPMVLQTTLD